MQPILSYIQNDGRHKIIFSAYLSFFDNPLVMDVKLKGLYSRVRQATRSHCTLNTAERTKCRITFFFLLKQNQMKEFKERKYYNIK